MEILSFITVALRAFQATPALSSPRLSPQQRSSMGWLCWLGPVAAQCLSGAVSLQHRRPWVWGLPGTRLSWPKVVLSSLQGRVAAERGDGPSLVGQCRSQGVWPPSGPAALAVGTCLPSSCLSPSHCCVWRIFP